MLSTSSKRSRGRSSDILPPLAIEDISAPANANWDEKWISATKTRNFMLKDPLCDWLGYNYSSLVTSKPTYTRDIFKALSNSGSSRNFSFPEYLMKQGTIFEDKVLYLLREQFGNDMVAGIGGELNPRSPTKVQETVNAMNKGIPIIHSGVLHNPENKTYGIPDLLVRSDWLNSLVTLSPLLRNEKHIPALRLRDPLNPDSAPSYHYRVVDVKFSTLLLRADGINLLNASSFPAYKSQLCIYNQALARIQGYDPQKAYILGRRWKFSFSGSSFAGDSCFDRLGTISYDNVDLKYIDLTSQALDWLREVRSEKAEKWSLSTLPFPKPELYPNMSNTHDHPWRPIKEKIARDIYELTSLWMVGVKHREHAHARGILGWDDEKCISENLGIKEGGYTSRILDEILKVNQPHLRERYPRPVYPEIISNNYCDWQHPSTIEFKVDFETVNDVITNFEGLPFVTSTALIFMIGVGHRNPLTNDWIHVSFIADNLTLEEEEKICGRFAEYVRSEAALYDVDKPLCVHWAPAEEKMWKKAMERHPDVCDSWKSGRWKWFDLLKVFKEEPVVVRGALNFSLKSITKALRENNCIDIGWNTNSSCLDGRGAMIGAYKADEKARKMGVSMKETPEIAEISEYNKIDVKALDEILVYLRENHIVQREKRKRAAIGNDSSEGVPFPGVTTPKPALPPGGYAKKRRTYAKRTNRSK